MSKIYIGNVRRDGQSTRGWFIGRFIEDLHSLRHSNNLEVKWREHKKGEKRNKWSISENMTTMGLVIKGKMRMIFKDEEFLLRKGDYYISPPQMPHKWIIEEDSLVLTIQWLSE